MRTLRIIGPLKRAYEYPVLLDRFRADPIEYLKGEISRIPAATVGNNMDTNVHIQTQLHDDGNRVLELLAEAGGTTNPQDCATQLVQLLRVLSRRLNPLTTNECK